MSQILMKARITDTHVKPPQISSNEEDNMQELFLEELFDPEIRKAVAIEKINKIKKRAEFTVGAMFKSYMTEIKKILTEYVMVNFKEVSVIYPSSGEVSTYKRKNGSLEEFIKFTLYDKARIQSEINRGVDPKIFSLEDGDNCFGSSHGLFAYNIQENTPFWDIERRVIETYGEDEMDGSAYWLIKEFCESSKRYFGGAPFQKIFDKVFSRICHEHLQRYESAEVNINKNPQFLVKKAKDLAPAEKMYLLKRLHDMLWEEACNYAMNILLNAGVNTLMCGEIIVNCDSAENERFKQNYNILFEKADALKKKLKTAEDALHKTNERFSKLVKEKNEEIESLKAVIEKYENELNKDLKKQDIISDLRNQLKREREKTNELMLKCDNLIKKQQEIVIKQSEEEAVESINDIAKPFKDKRIVFVRMKETEGYTIMQKLTEFFENSKLVCSANEINENTTDLVVILTKYIAHGSYWKTRDSMREGGVPCIHCDKSSLSGIVQTIAKALL